MRFRSRWVWVAALGTAVVSTVLLALAGPAQAAFPGRNGLLAVEPLNGPGVVLVKANGHGERLLCQAGSACANGCFSGFICPASYSCPLACASPLRPAWSPDGRALAVFGKTTYPDAAGGQSVSGSSVIYADGSCLACDGPKSFGLFATPFAGPGDAAFTSDPTRLTAVVAGQPGGTPPVLLEFGVDGVGKKELLLGPYSDPVWSSRGQLAVVRGGWIWVGTPRKLRRLTPGTAPSWSPDGKQIVFQRRGWLLIGSVRGRSFRRLVQGSAPAWSPDGRRIAFFRKSHRLNVMPAGGGHVRHVGRITGSTVDWQPLPAKRAGTCVTPPGSTVIASSDAAIVSLDNLDTEHSPVPDPVETSATMGCLRADGRERLLHSYSWEHLSAQTVKEAATAGTYAALVTHSAQGRGGPVEVDSGVGLFDLRTGTGAAVPGRRGEQASCSYTYPSPPCDTIMDSLVLGSDAVSAVHTTVKGQDMNGNTCTCTVEQIQASDSTGVHALDIVTAPDGSPPALTNLILTGDTLTWNNDGSPRSAQLQP